MPVGSLPTARNRLEKQEVGDKINLWGAGINQALDALDQSLDGRLALALTGATITLDAVNFIPNQARSRVLVLTGTTGTIQLPGVEKWYIVANQAAGNALVQVSGGTPATVRPGTVAIVLCDGTNCLAIDPTLDQARPPVANVAMNGRRLTGLADATGAQDAATKAQVDAVRAYAQGIANSGILAPGATNGWFLRWDAGTGWHEAAIPPLVAGNNTTVAGSFEGGDMRVNVDLTTATDFLFTLAIARP